MTRTATNVPDYDPLLVAFHRAFRPELRRAVHDLPVPRDGLVLDIPCGDGFYTRLLARRLGPAGRVVGADQLPAYLRRARRAAEKAGLGDRTEFVPADAYALPF